MEDVIICIKCTLMRINELLSTTDIIVWFVTSDGMNVKQQ